MNYKFYIVIMSSFFSLPIFSSDASKEVKTPSLKNKYHMTTSEIYEKSKRLPLNEQIKIARKIARIRIAKKIDPNLSPAQVADQLNVLFNNPLYKSLLGVRIACNVNGTIQPFLFQRCFLKGVKGEADINRWVAPGYSPRK